MTVNFPGPYEARFYYTVNNGSVVNTHVHRVNVQVVNAPAPGTAMADIDLIDKSLALVAADTTFTTWANLIKVRWAVNASNAITHVELWQYVANSYDAFFISTMPLNIATTGAGGTQVAGQEIYVFRTEEGGTMKISFMETVQAIGSPLTYTQLSANTKLIVDFVVAPVNAVWLARDTSFPIAFTRMFPGQNEALFKKAFRN
jgi:hypothetical protein